MSKPYAPASEPICSTMLEAVHQQKKPLAVVESSHHESRKDADNTAKNTNPIGSNISAMFQMPMLQPSSLKPDDSSSRTNPSTPTAHAPALSRTPRAFASMALDATPNLDRPPSTPTTWDDLLECEPVHSPTSTVSAESRNVATAAASVQKNVAKDPATSNGIGRPTTPTANTQLFGKPGADTSHSCNFLNVKVGSRSTPPNITQATDSPVASNVAECQTTTEMTPTISSAGDVNFHLDINHPRNAFCKPLILSAIPRYEAAMNKLSVADAIVAKVRANGGKLIAAWHPDEVYEVGNDEARDRIASVLKRCGAAIRSELRWDDSREVTASRKPAAVVPATSGKTLVVRKGKPTAETSSAKPTKAQKPRQFPLNKANTGPLASMIAALTREERALLTRRMGMQNLEGILRNINGPEITRLKKNVDTLMLRRKTRAKTEEKELEENLAIIRELKKTHKQKPRPALAPNELAILSDRDIWLGRGGGCNNHPGTRLFRTIVAQYVVKHQRSGCKRKVCKDIRKYCTDTLGMRFFQQAEGDLHRIVTDNEIIERKIGQRLRDVRKKFT
ncbi:MAG: hypothetical protein SGILL_001346 [Bacillariaceae sp.]